MITECFTRNCNKVEVLKWVIARMQPMALETSVRMHHKTQPLLFHGRVMTWRSAQQRTAKLHQGQSRTDQGLRLSRLVRLQGIGERSAGDKVEISVLPNVQLSELRAVS